MKEMPSYARVIYIILTVMLTCLLFISPARADVGPRPIVPPGSSLKPGTDTPVQMLAEQVILTIRRATAADSAAFLPNPNEYGLSTGWMPAVADVSADFRMTNPTGEAVDMVVWFPLAAALETEDIPNRITTFKVWVASKPVTYEVIELPNPKGGDKPQVPWAKFQVSFPAGKETPIKVTYLLPPQLTPGDNVGMDFSYIFQTGAGWAGPIGQAELIVKLPYPASEETIGSMPEGGQVQGSQVSWTWENLEPGAQDDFAIHLLYPTQWQDLLKARQAVQARPGDGKAWLELARTYEFLTCAKGLVLAKDFGKVYYPLGVEAFQEAARLIPEDPDPHIGLGALYLTIIFTQHSGSPEEIQRVEDELKLADERRTGQGYSPADDLREFLGYFLENQAATATAIATSQTPTPSSSPIPSFTPTIPPLPTATPIPVFTSTAITVETATTTPLSVTPTPAAQKNAFPGGDAMLLIAIGFAFFAGIGVLLLRRKGR